jgi:hypothetical protein
MAAKDIYPIFMLTAILGKPRRRVIVDPKIGPRPEAHKFLRSAAGGFFGAALLAVTFCAYQPAWNGKPIFDDVMYLTNTVELRSLSGLAHLWTEPQTTRQYHPLLDTVFWVEDKLWGDSMLGYQDPRGLAGLRHLCPSPDPGRIGGMAIGA